MEIPSAAIRERCFEPSCGPARGLLLLFLREIHRYHLRRGRPLPLELQYSEQAIATASIQHRTTIGTITKARTRALFLTLSRLADISGKYSNVCNKLVEKMFVARTE